MSYDNSIYDGVEFVAHDLENMRKQYERLRYETAILRAEVRAWREQQAVFQNTFPGQPERYAAVLKVNEMRKATDSANALEKQ